MVNIDRRRFLQLAGGTAALTMLTRASRAPRPSPPNRTTGTIQDVEHIVVLMQENRSFDHYFGTLSGVRGFGDPRPVTLPTASRSGTSRTARRTSCRSTRTPTTWACSSSQGLAARLDRRPRRPSTRASTTSGCRPRRPTTMAYLTREDIPFHYALADAFTVCDAYHCSFIGSTDPNRYYMWTGYTGNDGKGGGPVLGNDEAGYGWTTYPERLEAAGVSWKIYQDIGDGLDAAGSWGWISDAYRGNYGDNSLLYFNQYRNAKPGNPLYDKARTGTNASDGRGLLRPADGRRQGRHAARRSPGSPRPRRSPSTRTGPPTTAPGTSPRSWTRSPRTPTVWAKTALFITYDENDGFFDHVVPPFPPHVRRAGPVHGRRRARTSTRATRATPPARTGSARACRCSSSRPGARAATSAPRPSTTPRSSGSWRALRRAGAQHLAVAARGLRRPDLGLRLLPHGAGAGRCRTRRLRAHGPRATPTTGRCRRRSGEMPTQEAGDASGPGHRLRP